MKYNSIDFGRDFLENLSQFMFSEVDWQTFSGRFRHSVRDFGKIEKHELEILEKEISEFEVFPNNVVFIKNIPNTDNQKLSIILVLARVNSNYRWTRLDYGFDLIEKYAEEADKEIKKYSVSYGLNNYGSTQHIYINQIIPIAYPLSMKKVELKISTLCDLLIKNDLNNFERKILLQDLSNFKFIMNLKNHQIDLNTVDESELPSPQIEYCNLLINRID